MSKGRPTGICRTCGSEIVESVNDSVFGMGECDGCERQRYESQHVLIETLHNMIELADSVVGTWENGCLAESVTALGRASAQARDAVEKAEGKT